MPKLTNLTCIFCGECATFTFTDHIQKAAVDLCTECWEERFVITPERGNVRVRFAYEGKEIEVRLSQGEGIVVRAKEGSLQVQPRYSNEVGIFVWD